eukprot:scaffold43062_cov206-Amphora_coffeaeformis.AAC.3
MERGLGAATACVAVLCRQVFYSRLRQKGLPIGVWDLLRARRSIFPAEAGNTHFAFSEVFLWDGYGGPTLDHRMDTSELRVTLPVPTPDPTTGHL